MKLRKLFVILLALLVVFSFVACGGSGGGSDDNGGTNGDNGGNVDPPAETWPVTYYFDLSELIGEEGFGLFIDFFKDGSYRIGDVVNYVKYSHGTGTYTGDNPHSDGTINATGEWFYDGEIINIGDFSVSITSGTIISAGGSFIRQ